MLMRPGEFWEAMWAHQQEVQAERRHIGELVRGMTARLCNIQLEAGKGIKDIHKFWPMPWDEDTSDLEKKRIKSIRNASQEQRNQMAADFLSKISK